MHVGGGVRRRQQVHRGTVAARSLVVPAWLGLLALGEVASGGFGRTLPIVVVVTFLGAAVTSRKVGRLRARDPVAARWTLGLAVFAVVTTVLLIVDVATPGPLTPGAEVLLGAYEGFGAGVYDLAVVPIEYAWLVVVPLWLWLQASTWLRTRGLPSWLRGAATLITAMLAVVSLAEVASSGLEPWIATVVLVALPSVVLASRTAWQAVRPGADPPGTWETEGPLQRRRLFTGRQPIRVVLLLLLSMVLGLAGWLMAEAQVSDELLLLLEVTDPETFVLAFALVTLGLSLGLTALAVLAYLGARRRAAQRSAEVLARDTRAPVLYLRSFRDDRVRVRVHNSPRRALIVRMLGRSRERFEEVIVWHLWRFGPVVGVGRPADRLPPLGAAREYLSDDQWRGHVESMMRCASLVVVAIGRTDGLRWEMQTLHRLGVDHKAILVMPPVSQEERDERWSSLRRLAVQIGWPALPPRADGHALVHRPATERGWLQVTGDDLDEWNYEVALEVAASSGSVVGAGSSQRPDARARGAR